MGMLDYCYNVLGDYCREQYLLLETLEDLKSSRGLGLSNPRIIYEWMNPFKVHICASL